MPFLHVSAETTNSDRYAISLSPFPCCCERPFLETPRELRSSPDEYLPFLGLAEGEEFEEYCGKVRGSAEWGGQVELQVRLSMSACVRGIVFAVC